LGILWLANPDLTLHYQQPGSAEHLEALSATDQMVEMVSKAVQAARNEAEILFIVTSDHGHEVIGDSIHISQWLAANGLSHEIQAGDICVAGQGTSALLYATEHGKARLTEKLEHIKQQEWVAAVLDAGQLARLGLPESRHLAMGIDMARFDTVNAYGVSGARWMVEDGEKGVAMHCGQHGGLGLQETHPFLFINHPAHAAATMAQRTSLVDIAPTILDFLSVPHEAMDGQSLLK
jgi:arylsulfatase A-like enzyme